ncbi:MAG: transglycosylase domain-containing protein, partial [Eubacterium sp.]|nr:transglycosylase domain-containing protein [Eubacterium sp.]
MNFGYKETIDKQKELVSVQKKLAFKSLVSLLKGLLYVFCLFLVVCGAFVFGLLNGIIESAPSLDKVSILPSSYSTNVYDAKKKPIAKLITSGSNRIRVDLKDVPECLQWAFIDTEDARFYEHNGIDIQGIGRAAFTALTTMDASEGASTITQQVLKNNVFTDWTSESTFSSSVKRKIQEQYLAVQLEKTTNKSLILETYLNTINLGSNTLGVQAASHRYFNKDVSEINPSEAAVIAAITQNPSRFNPIINPEANAKRRKKILKNMLKSNHLTQKQYDKALKDKVYERIQKVNTQLEKSEDKVYTYFVDEVTKQVMEDLQTKKGYTETQAYNAVYSGGLKIYTTQDSAIQKICDEELSNSANYPYAIKYSINWRWSVENPDGTVDEYDEQDIEDYRVNVCHQKNFQLLFSSKEEAKSVVKNYKKHLKQKYYPKGLSEKKGYSQMQTLYYVPEPQVSFTVMDQ